MNITEGQPLPIRLTIEATLHPAYVRPASYCSDCGRAYPCEHQPDDLLAEGVYRRILETILSGLFTVYADGSGHRIWEDASYRWEVREDGST